MINNEKGMKAWNYDYLCSYCLESNGSWSIMLYPFEKDFWFLRTLCGRMTTNKQGFEYKYVGTNKFSFQNVLKTGNNKDSQD